MAGVFILILAVTSFSSYLGFMEVIIWEAEFLNRGKFSKPRNRLYFYFIDMMMAGFKLGLFEIKQCVSFPSLRRTRPR